MRKLLPAVTAWRIGAAVLSVLATAACGSSSAVVPAVTSASSSPAAAATSATVASDTPTPSGAVLEVPSASAAGLPGTPYSPAPTPGRPLAVLGLAAGSTLPLLALPGSGRTLTSVGPLTTGLVASGRARLVGPGGTAVPWVEVTVRGRTGWVDARHVEQTGDPTDVTAETLRRLGAAATAADVTALGRAVGAAWASQEPASAVVVAAGPSGPAPGEVSVDVVGLGDDSVAGYRLRVVAKAADGSVTVGRVTSTPFCYRGVSSAGRCV